MFALMNRRDPDHEAVRMALMADRGPYLVPAGILAEIGYLLDQRHVGVVGREGSIVVLPG